MSQPEISLRCSSCGAAVREPAMFCPECGKPLTTTSPRTEPAAEILKAFLASADLVPIPDRDAQTSPAPVDVAAAAANPERTTPRTGPPDESGLPHGARQRTKERLHRASTAARGAIGDNVKRVEKIQHVSSVMFEEAHYDPSLRFVLVALGLFIIAAILLVLNKVMG